MNGKRAQSAMEYLMTYGWAFLILAIVIIALYQLGIFGLGGISTGTSCSGSVGYLCQTPILNTSGWLAARVSQGISSSITVTNVGCTTNTTPPSSTGSLNLLLQSGSSATIAFYCPIKYNSIGSNFEGYLWWTYNTQYQSDLVDRIGAVTAKVTTSGSALAAEGGTGGVIGVTTTTTTTTSTTSTSITTTSSTSTTSTSTTSTSTTTILPPVLETHADSPQTSSSSATTGSFTTSNTNDMIVAVVVSDGGTGTPGVSDLGGSTWTLQSGGTGGLNGACGQIWVYYAMPGKTLSGDTVTASRSGTIYIFQVFVLAVSNANTFDSNGSLPSIASTTSSNTISTAYSTSNPNDLILGVTTSCHGPPGPSWTGLTGLDYPSGGYYADAYKIVSSTQSGATATATWSSDETDDGIVVTAVSST
ncbi:MAG: hypothetical protein ACREBF_00045 [Candidatus Micrarchaeales archaeon]